MLAIAFCSSFLGAIFTIYYDILSPAISTTGTVLLLVVVACYRHISKFLCDMQSKLIQCMLFYRCCCFDVRLRRPAFFRPPYSPAPSQPTPYKYSYLTSRKASPCCLRSTHSFFFARIVTCFVNNSDGVALSHVFFVILIEVFFFPISLYFCSLNLYELIKKNNYNGFSMSLIRRFCNSIVKCLRLLYKENIIHCDLKPVRKTIWYTMIVLSYIILSIIIFKQLSYYYFTYFSIGKYFA